MGEIMIASCRKKALAFFYRGCNHSNLSTDGRKVKKNSLINNASH